MTVFYAIVTNIKALYAKAKKITLYNSAVLIGSAESSVPEVAAVLPNVTHPFYHLLWLVGIVTSVVLGQGFLTIEVASLFGLVPVVMYCRTYRSTRFAVLSWWLTAFAMFLGYKDFWSTPDITPPAYSHVILFLWLCFCNVCTILIPLSADLFSFHCKHISDPLKVFIFPAFFSLGGFLFSRASPLGSWFLWGYAVRNEDLVRGIGAMGGIHALNFYVAWIASLISNEYIQHKHKQNNTPCRNGYLLVAEPTESNSNYESDEDSDASLAGNNEHRRLLEDAHPAHTRIEVESVEVIQNDVVMNEAPGKKRRWGAQIIYPFLRAMSRPTVIFIIVSTVIFFHSSFMKYLFQSNHFFNPFWTPPIQDYAPAGTSINASCILGHYKFNQSDASEYLTQTRIVAGWGSNLILWSEAAVVLPDESRKQILFDRILKITKTHNTTVGISYYMPIQAPSQMVQGNFFALIGPAGLLYEYQKVHPVFGVETGTAPGEGSMPVVEVPGVGRVGIGVCLDLDFEGWAKTAGREKAQIVLNPAWNWGATGALHTLHARHRAVEQGFTLFRCASYSLSGIYNPDFTIAHERPTPVGEGWEYAIKLVSLKVGERARVGTLYAMWGDWIIVLSVLLLFAALLQEMKGRWSVIRRRHSIETL